MNRSYTTPFAVVIGSDVSVWGSDAGMSERPTHGLSTDLPGLLDGVSRMCERYSLPEVPVIIDTATPVTDYAPQVEQLRAAGWHFTDLRTWTRFTRDGNAVYLGIRSGFTASRTPLFDGCNSPAEIHAAAVAFHRLLGTPFWGAPGMVGCELIRREAPAKEPRWLSPLPVPVKPAGPLHWRTRVAPVRDVASFDVNAAYVASAGVSEVAADALVHSTDSQFYPGRAGYWRVRFDPARVAELVATSTGPRAFDWSRVAPDGTAWLTAPVARYVLADRVLVPWEIVESWTAPGVRAVLRPWSDRLRAAYVDTYGTAGRVQTAVKRVYKDTTGMLAREGGRVHRPDWAHHIIDLSRVNLVRRLQRAGTAWAALALAVMQAPRLVGVTVDEVHYELGEGQTAADVLAVLNRPEHREGHPGTMKHSGTATAAQWCADHMGKRGRS